MATRVAVLGGGPAGLVAARLLARGNPSWQVTVHERHQPDASFGYGVGLGHAPLALLREADPELREAIEAIALTVGTWTMVRDGERVSASNSHGLGVSRARLLEVLARLAGAAGVDVRVGVEAEASEVEADIVVAADGVGSRTRERLAPELGARVSRGELHYLWCGAPLARPEMTLAIARTGRGPVAAHVMPYAAAASTFQVDARRETVAAWEAEPGGRGHLEHLEGLFADLLGGARLEAKRPEWSAFPTVTCDRWWAGNVVLAGDAAHTAHYTVGSGTGLAVEDAVELARALSGSASIEDAFIAYEAARRPRVARIQERAARSERWWSTLALRVDLPLPRLLVSYLTRTGAVSLDLLAEHNRPLLAAALPGAVAGVPAAELAGAILAQPYSANGRSAPHREVAGDGAATLVVEARELSLPALREQVRRAAALAAGTSGRVRLAGPGDAGAVRLRLELAEHLRAEGGVTSIVAGPPEARAELALGVLSGRTDLVEVAG